MTAATRVRPRAVAHLAWQLPVAAGLAALAVLAAGPHPAALPLLYLAAVTPELVRVDLREHRLPNRLVLPGVALGLVVWGIIEITDDDPSSP